MTTTPEPTSPSSPVAVPDWPVIVEGLLDQLDDLRDVCATLHTRLDDHTARLDEQAARLAALERRKP